MLMLDGKSIEQGIGMGKREKVLIKGMDDMKLEI